MTTGTEQKRILHGNYFYGEKVSDYGIEHKRVDYRTLAKAFDAVQIDAEKLFFTQIGDEWSEPELINGTDYDDDTDSYDEVFQWFLIDANGANILQEWTNEIVYYLPALDAYFWGVTHCGTSWDYVLTDIEITEADECDK